MGIRCSQEGWKRRLQLKGEERMQSLSWKDDSQTAPWNGLPRVAAIIARVWRLGIKAMAWPELLLSRACSLNCVSVIREAAYKAPLHSGS